MDINLIQWNPLINNIKFKTFQLRSFPFNCRNVKKGNNNEKCQIHKKTDFLRWINFSMILLRHDRI